MIQQPQRDDVGRSFNADDLSKIVLAESLEAAKSTRAGAEILERIAAARKAIAVATADLVMCRAELGRLIGSANAQDVFESIKAEPAKRKR